MLKRTTAARYQFEPQSAVLKVIDIDEFLKSSYAPQQCALWCADASRINEKVATVPWGAMIDTSSAIRPMEQGRWITKIEHAEVISPGDVISLSAGRQQVSVLYRRGANANFLFVTPQCNSLCVMCSQPPRAEDDPARISTLHRVIDLIDQDLPALGFTGGEPTLLGQNLLDLIDHCRTSLPATHLHILTNGRLFADKDFAARAARIGHENLTWAVPLYTDAADIHDFVVQRPGAFVETMQGIYNLAERGQSIELRIVLQKSTVGRLEEFARFVRRNLSFVSHVAFMGLEPIGYARMNREMLWLDPKDYAEALRRAVLGLASWSIPVSIYNLPLCVLPQDVWGYSRKSISDWKNKYLEICDRCAVRPECAGFFEWAKEGWISRGIRPVQRQNN